MKEEIGDDKQGEQDSEEERLVDEFDRGERGRLRVEEEEESELIMMV